MLTSGGTRSAAIVRLLVVLGTALFVFGAVAIVQAVVPVRLGNVDWEIGAIGGVTVGAALPVIGLVALAVAAHLLRAKKSLLGLSALAWLGGLAALIGMVIMLTDMPVVWSAVKGATARQAMSVKIAVVKTVALSGLYAIFLMWYGWFNLSSALALRRK